MMPEAGDQAPDFTLPSTQGEIKLQDLTQKQKVLLAFYTEDNTPLCSSEMSVLKEDYEILQQLGAQVIAISADSLESHRRFAEKLGGVPFPLASDENLEAAGLYGVAGDDGKRCRRAVFVIDRGGKVLHAVPWFQPGNPTQYEEVFVALGFEA
jgi:peroxiredoxin Q/BCP